MKENKNAYTVKSLKMELAITEKLYIPDGRNAMQLYLV